MSAERFDHPDHNGQPPRMNLPLQDPEEVMNFLSQTAVRPNGRDLFVPFSTGIYMVGPELATAILTRNTHNRDPKAHGQSRYRNDMASGEWLFTAFPISFDWNGRLIDGQNRLMAIRVTGVTLPCVINWGLDPAAQEVMDTGVPRRLNDVLKLRGEKNVVKLGGVLRRCYLWDNGFRKNLKHGTIQVSTTQLLMYLDANPDIRDFVEGNTAIKAPTSVVGCFRRVFSQIDKEDADFFFGRLADGQGLIEGDPIYALRKTLDRFREDRRHTVDDNLRSALIIKAWNAYRQGTPIKVLSWRGGGASPEAFPEPI